MNDEQLQREKLNLETGLIQWTELQRYFAKGVLIEVDGSLDLVEVAQHFVNDSKAQIENWIADAKVCRANDSHAKQWQQQNAVFWAIVVTPWVLVQECKQDVAQRQNENNRETS